MARAGLTPALIVARAEEIIDASGLDALTLARLASDLGAATPSLYKHVSGLDDLVNRVATATTSALADEAGASIRGLSGPAALRAFATAYRAFAHRHPGTYPLTQGESRGAAWDRAADDILSSLSATVAGYGLTRDDVDALRLLRSALHGFVDLERRGGFHLDSPADESFAFLVDALDAALDASARRGTSLTPER